jgi:hypothetical protein
VAGLHSGQHTTCDQQGGKGGKARWGEGVKTKCTHVLGHLHHDNSSVAHKGETPAASCGGGGLLHPGDEHPAISACRHTVSSAPPKPTQQTSQQPLDKSPPPRCSPDISTLYCTRRASQLHCYLISFQDDGVLVHRSLISS